MQKVLKSWILFPFWVLCLQGCAPLLVGAAGVVGGVAISEDTVQSDVDVGYSRVWNVALNEIEKMKAEVTLQDKSKGLIEAKIGASKVRVHIDPLTDETIRIHVKARKHFLPNIKLAHKISARILEKL